MVPMAGDEITEKIAAHFLLDFKSAENLKVQIAAEKPITLQGYYRQHH